MTRVEARTTRALVAFLLPLVLGGIALLCVGRFADNGSLVLLNPVMPLALGAYLLSHLLRAVRLSVVAARILPLRTRTLTLLHFNAAPVSLLLPFKLGDLYRLQQLASLSGNVVRPLLVMLVERTLDAGVLLVVVILLLFWGGLPQPLYLISLGLGLVLLVALSLLTLASPALAAFQHYIVTTHYSQRMLRVLQAVDFLRRSIEAANLCLRGHMGLLLCLTGLIWLLEAATLLILTPALVGDATLLARSSLAFALTPGLIVDGVVAHAIISYAALTFSALVAVWPIATVMYMRQIARPDWRPTRRISSDAEPAPLSDFERSRALRLFIPRRSL